LLNLVMKEQFSGASADERPRSDTNWKDTDVA
jgi:hypothetical protein